MQTYFPGQRWIRETEPELGLGLVVEITHRTVQVLYHAANEIRHYAIGNAPLKRVRFSAGGKIESRATADRKDAYPTFLTSFSLRTRSHGIQFA